MKGVADAGNSKAGKRTSKKEIEEKLMSGAKIAVKTCMNIKKGEKVLIITDTVKEQIGQALFNAAKDVKAEVLLLKMIPRTRHGEEPPKAVAEIMRHVDVIIAPTEYSISHTQARKRANKAGARIATMPGITEEMFAEGGMTADFRKVERTINKVYSKLKGLKKVKITTELGTDLSMSIEGRRWIRNDTGICHKKGAFTNLPAGELFIPPLEGSANGTLIIDGAFPSILEKPVEVTIKDGDAVKMVGATKVWRELKKRKGGTNVAELGIGMNPNARVIGNVLEDEKALGTIHIAFGDNSTFGGKVKAGIHMDGIIMNPTLIIDDVVVLEKGKLKL